MKVVLIVNIVILSVLAVLFTVGLFLLMRANAKLEQHEKDLEDKK